MPLSNRDAQAMSDYLLGVIYYHLGMESHHKLDRVCTSFKHLLMNLLDEWELDHDKSVKSPSFVM